MQSVPQVIPAGDELTVPAPVPAGLTVSAKVETGTVVKVAVTERAAVIVTTQVEVPEHAPLQPAKNEPATGAADSVTTLP